eukprot:6208650-Pleurochrysis_carterae.AAC.1
MPKSALAMTVEHPRRGLTSRAHFIGARLCTRVIVLRLPLVQHMGGEARSRALPRKHKGRAHVLHGHSYAQSNGYEHAKRAHFCTLRTKHAGTQERTRARTHARTHARVRTHALTCACMRSHVHACARV